MKWTTSLTVVFIMVATCIPGKGYTADAVGLSPETVADYVHAVVQSHRAFYTVHVAQLLEEQGIASAGSEWSTQKKTIPLPVQVVNETNQMFSTKFSGLRYQLISLWPINRKNSPRDPIDKSSLETLGERPERPVARTVKIDDQVYFRAIYPDLAVSPSCVACHNSHPNSPKKDFQVGDIMGGLVIEFPLGTQ
ncbi:MAG: hypothetical protein Nkreftii_003958 [Candidatus Nitrospira kreftii]|uniref:Tll0287-like domain-containing protein n=1 Tax=Candidatus Nitrospira kreftii TaxID=2652173 RepID=A0A7S8FHN9_9BACT|nr:MAG: hypothetical protein Nkreftii_003958 [Candidatus Nitrospira kreftii]